MSMAFCGQNHTLMNVGVRPIAYPHTRWGKKCPALTLREQVNEAGRLHVPSAAIVVERRSKAVWRWSAQHTESDRSCRRNLRRSRTNSGTWYSTNGEEKRTCKPLQQSTSG